MDAIIYPCPNTLASGNPNLQPEQYYMTYGCIIYIWFGTIAIYYMSMYNETVMHCFWEMIR